MFVSEKYMKFSFRNLGNDSEDKNGRIQTTFGFKI